MQVNRDRIIGGWGGGIKKSCIEELNFGNQGQVMAYGVAGHNKGIREGMKVKLLGSRCSHFSRERWRFWECGSGLHGRDAQNGRVGAEGRGVDSEEGKRSRKGAPTPWIPFLF